MSHELDLTRGEAAMAYVGENGAPWHKLGKAVKKGISAKEMAKAAGLDWLVNTTKVRFDRQIDGKTVDQLDDYHQVMYRSDTGMVLDITGPGYVPHQNIEVLEFFQEYVDVGDMYLDTAGSLKDGRYIWAMAQMERSFNLPGKDEVQGRVLLMNPHVYGKGMIAKICVTRVVCWNTITLALSEQGKSVKIWHTKEFNKARQDEVKQNLGIARDRLDAFKDDAKTLTKLTMPDEDLLKIAIPIFNGKVDKPLEEQGRTINRIFELYNGAGMGAELTSAKGTAWGFLNAATQFIDHEYGRTDDSRLSNSWLGTGETQKVRLMRDLLVAAR